MKTQTVKGFQDFIGDEALKRAKIKSIIEESFKLYGFEPAETPIIEFEEFVKGDNQNDEAVSDIFKLEDKGKRKLALRYETTFQLKRIAKNQKLPFRRYQIGPVFRDEPISSDRFRQFTQCDADIIGSSLKDEAELLTMVQKILDKLGIKSKILFNNRKLINEILVSENIEEKNREQAIREIDKLDKISASEVAKNLKKIGAEKLVKIFNQPEKSFEKYNFYKEIKELKKLCKNYRVKIEFQPTLARGLSYYNGSIFEIKASEESGTICAGGAYLINNIQSTGLAFGLERLSMLTKIEPDKIKYLIISIEQDKKAIALAENLRGSGNPTILLQDKAISKALDYANSKGVEKVIFVGKDEVKSGKFKVKDMKTGKETSIAENKF
jgi:histidyl-tRNA synthetase